MRSIVCLDAVWYCTRDRLACALVPRAFSLFSTSFPGSFLFLGRKDPGKELGFKIFIERWCHNAMTSHCQYRFIYRKSFNTKRTLISTLNIKFINVSCIDQQSGQHLLLRNEYGTNIVKPCIVSFILYQFYSCISFPMHKRGDKPFESSFFVSIPLRLLFDTSLLVTS